MRHCAHAGAVRNDDWLCSRLLGSSSRLGLCMHYENESSMYMHTKRSTRACVHARHVGETCSTGLGKYVPWGNWLIKP